MLVDKTQRFYHTFDEIKIHHDNILAQKDLCKQLYHTILELCINQVQNQIGMDEYR